MAHGHLWLEAGRRQRVPGTGYFVVSNIRSGSFIVGNCVSLTFVILYFQAGKH